MVLVWVILCYNAELDLWCWLTDTHLALLAYHHTTSYPPEIKILLSIFAILELQDLYCSHLAFTSLDTGIPNRRFATAIRAMDCKTSRKALLPRLRIEFSFTFCTFTNHLSHLR